MTTNMWLLTLFISEFITGCVGYSLGRSNRNNIRKPKAITCDHEYWNSKIFKNYICKQIWHKCKSGFCNKHCKSQNCNCTQQSELETEILEEVKQITRG